MSCLLQTFLSPSNNLINIFIIFSVLWIELNLCCCKGQINCKDLLFLLYLKIIALIFSNEEVNFLLFDCRKKLPMLIGEKSQLKILKLPKQALEQITMESN